MDWKKLLQPENEKPLDRIVDDGGFAAIFRSFACVGDSLSSGEFETLDAEGNKGYHDLYEYSWGQYMARAMGSSCLNFSRGGMTAREYMDGWALNNGCWDKKKACQAYIFAMGANDITAALREGTDLGKMADVKKDWRENTRSFAGDFAAIIQRYKEIEPDAFFFLLTMPVCPGDRPQYQALSDRHQELMKEMGAHFPNTYVIDLRKYAPVYDAEFEKAFHLNGHLNPAGYILTAKMVMSYMDFIIRSDMPAFAEVGLIGTPFVNIKK